jgi:putative membrane protein
LAGKVILLLQGENEMMGGWLGGAGCCGFGTYGWLGLILNLVIFAGVIVGLVLLIRWATGKISSGTISRSVLAGDSARGDSAPEILKRRYARGEITQEQYREMLSDLT